MPDFEKNNIRPPCYGCPIVYGTISSFAVDFLMDQLEFESIRGSRRCEALLISEVSKPMMHDTLQFTQRAHSAPFLKHVEPVLALVWTITNCYTSLQTHSQKRGYMQVLKATSFNCNAMCEST